MCSIKPSRSMGRKTQDYPKLNNKKKKSGKRKQVTLFQVRGGFFFNWMEITNRGDDPS